jgi:hypothetical protein
MLINYPTFLIFFQQSPEKGLNMIGDRIVRISEGNRPVGAKEANFGFSPGGLRS